MSRAMGAIGLITYMRTDSLRISEDAIARTATTISRSRYGDRVPAQTSPGTSSPGQTPRTPTRPSAPPAVSLTPEQVKGSLTADQYRLYKLIWERFIASQMANCVLRHHARRTSRAGQVSVQGLRLYRDASTASPSLYEEGKDEEEEAGRTLPRPGGGR